MGLGSSYRKATMKAAALEHVTPVEHIGKTCVKTQCVEGRDAWISSHPPMSLGTKGSLWKVSPGSGMESWCTD